MYVALIVSVTGAEEIGFMLKVWFEVVLYPVLISTDSISVHHI